MIKPSSNNVLLEPEDPPNKSEGGLFMPDGSMEDVVGTAKVIAVGPGRHSKKGKLEPLDVKPGDRVALFRFHMQSKIIKVDGNDYSIVAEPDIWGVIES